jgi:hypothetical protein
MFFIRIIILSVAVSFILFFPVQNSYAQSTELKEAFKNTKEAYKAGKLDKALNYAKNAIYISEKEFGFKNEITATLINNLGEIEMDMEQYKHAEKSFRTSTSIRKEILEADDPEIAESTSSIAVSLRKQLFFLEAMKYHKEALLIMSRAITKNNPHAINENTRKAALYRARAMHTKALIEIKNNHYGSAIGYLKTSSILFTSTLGRNKLELKETYSLMLNTAYKIRDEKTINLAKTNIEKLM